MVRKTAAADAPLCSRSRRDRVDLSCSTMLLRRRARATGLQPVVPMVRARGLSSKLRSHSSRRQR
jgi:hypothetical protein